VEIVAVARDVGRRSYIAVRSRLAEVDPVGACTGTRDDRIKAMVAELKREFLTVVWCEESAERFIRNALTPLSISKVELDPHLREALVTINDEGTIESAKQDSDLRLVSELTGWKITLRRVPK
jgi:transcription termination/antitermination protein NusA